MAINTFRAFRSRNYRLYFGGQCISLIGTWMQKTAVSWVVYSLTHSTFMLGVSLFASQFPSFLLSLFGGVVSDRYNRYKVLLVTQIASMVQATALTILIFTKYYNVWQVLSLSVVLGTINAFDVPARQSLVYQMVDNKDDLPNAIALNSSMVNLSRIIGPGIAGFVLEYLGDGYCFMSNALSFLAVIGSLLLMRLPTYEPKAHTKNAFGELREGLAYVKQTPSIAFVIVMIGMVSLFVLPYNTLIPYYAREIFKGNATTFGVIDSAIGAGAFVGALFLASLKPGSNLKMVLCINTLIFGIGLIFFSHQHLYLLSLLFALITGFGMMSQNAISNTLIQTTVEPAMRGRAISLYVMVFFGMQPLGGLLVGSLSKWIGSPDTILIEGLIALGIGLVHYAYLRKERLKEKRSIIAADDPQMQQVTVTHEEKV